MNHPPDALNQEQNLIVVARPNQDEDSVQSEAELEEERRAVGEWKERAERAETRALDTERLYQSTLRVLENGAMTSTDRILVVLLQNELSHLREKHGTSEVPVYMTGLGKRAGLSRSTVRKFFDNIEPAGVLTKRTEKDHIPPVSKRGKGTARSTAYVSQTMGRQDALDAFATFDPGRTRPGGNQKGKQPSKRIPTTCPSCGTDHTSLECQGCGVSFHTQDILSQNASKDKGLPMHQNGAQCTQVSGDQNGASEEGRPSYTCPPLQLGLIPHELSDLNQWVNWRYDKRGKARPKKIPINPCTGDAASVLDPNTWASLQGALEGLSWDGVDGIGFVFTEDDPFTGTDLDSCRTPGTGEIEQEAADIVRELCSYTEVTPSGKGLHVIVRGQLPKSGRKKGTIEMYDRGRFFTVTTHHLEGTPLSVEDRSAELLDVYGRVFGVEADDGPRDDEEVLDRAHLAQNGQKFARLWTGDWTGYQSQSHADLALCRMLAYWTENDEHQIDRLFRRSGLMRPKWDGRRGDAGTYGELTITKALNPESPGKQTRGK